MGSNALLRPENVSLSFTSTSSSIGRVGHGSNILTAEEARSAYRGRIAKLGARQQQNCRKKHTTRNSLPVPPLENSWKNLQKNMALYRALLVQHRGDSSA